MKKAGKIIAGVLSGLVAVLAVGIMIFTVVSVNTLDRSDRSVFGYSAYIVMSDSMSKTDFDAGDVILTKKVDPSTLKEGDIIAYRSRDNSNYGETVTHKIRRVTTDAAGEPGFITYGTTTDTDDRVMVTYSDVLGKYEMHVPNVGKFFYFLRTVPGYMICILLPFLLVLVSLGVNTVKLYKKYKSEKADAFREERLALEAERRQMEERVKELRELQEKLGLEEAQEEKLQEKPEFAEAQAEADVQTKEQAGQSRTFLAGIISLVLCSALFFGTTYAWLNETITAGVTIEAETLGVDLLDAEGNAWSGDAVFYEVVPEDGSLSSEAATVWVPEKTYQTAAMQIQNSGSLPAGYTVSVEGIADELKDAFTFSVLVNDQTYPVPYTGSLDVAGTEGVQAVVAFAVQARLSDQAVDMEDVDGATLSDVVIKITAEQVD